MILSTKSSIKFANKTKKNNLQQFLNEYKIVCQFFIDELWATPKVPVLIPKETTDKVQTWLTARAIQCAAKQASAIVRGTREELKRKNYVYEQLIKENRLANARRLKKIIDEKTISKPTLENVCPELDSRFIKIDLDNKTTFDGWLNITCLGNKLKIVLPFKKTKHFNEMLSQGKIKTGVRINNKSITFMFDVPDVEIRQNGGIIGLDVGILNTFTTSDGQKSKQDIHGHTLGKIQEKLSRKKKGSCAFEKVQEHRTNYINWTINQLNLTCVKQLRIENLKNVRKGNKSSRWLSHWTYTELFGKLNLLCSKLGVQVCKVSPTYTSQRCSQCGWVRKSNRKGKLFRCGECGYALDSDLNASCNIALELPPIGRKQRLKQENRKGFYWNVESQERIVPDAQLG